MIDEGVHRIAYYARDVAGNVDDGATTNGIANRAPRTASVRIDRTPPGVAFANSQDPARSRAAAGADRRRALAGRDPSRGWIGVRPAGSGDRFEPLPAVPGAERGAARPLGLRRLSRRATTNSGRSATTPPATPRPRRAGATARPMVLSNPLKATTTLRAGFRRRGRGGPFPTVAASSSAVGSTTGHQLAPGRNAGADRRALRRRRRTRRYGSRRSRTGARRHLLDPHRARSEPRRSRRPSTAARRSPARPRARSSSGCGARVRLRASAGVAKVGGAPLVFRGRLVAQPGEIPAEGRVGRSCSSGCRACPGRSSARSRPTGTVASATPTASATTTAAAPASSSAPTRPRKRTGRTSPGAHGQSWCAGAERRALAEERAKLRRRPGPRRLLARRRGR